MRFMLMMKSSGEDWTLRSPEEIQPVIDGHTRLIEELRQTDAYLGGEALRPATESRTISVDGDSFLLTDGPFIETKEQIGGFYLIEAASMDEAVEWAKKLAAVDGGPIEVRQVIYM
jgi:hypothetical protein